jgi:hypothetical protein
MTNGRESRRYMASRTWKLLKLVLLRAFCPAHLYHIFVASTLVDGPGDSRIHVCVGGPAYSQILSIRVWAGTYMFRSTDGLTYPIREWVDISRYYICHVLNGVVKV